VDKSLGYYRIAATVASSIKQKVSFNGKTTGTKALEFTQCLPVRDRSTSARGEQADAHFQAGNAVDEPIRHFLLTPK